jgi:hypothetical protein
MSDTDPAQLIPEFLASAVRFSHAWNAPPPADTPVRAQRRKLQDVELRITRDDALRTADLAAPRLADRRMVDALKALIVLRDCVQVYDTARLAAAWPEASATLRAALELLRAEGRGGPHAEPRPRDASTNSLVLDLVARRPEARDWTVRQVADSVRRSVGAVQKTTTWRTIMSGREQEKLDRIGRNGRPQRVNKTHRK